MTTPHPSTPVQSPFCTPNLTGAVSSANRRRTKSSALNLSQCRRNGPRTMPGACNGQTAQRLKTDGGLRCRTSSITLPISSRTSTRNGVFDMSDYQQSEWNLSEVQNATMPETEGERAMTLMNVALDCVRRGWYVLPCVPRTKRPLGGLVPNRSEEHTSELQ